MACSPGDNKAVSVVVNPVAGLTGFILVFGTTGVGVSGSCGVTGSCCYPKNKLETLPAGLGNGAI